MQRRKALRDKEFEAVVDLAGSVFGWSGSRRVGYVNPMAPVCRGFQLGCVGSAVVAWSWNVCKCILYCTQDHAKLPLFQAISFDSQTVDNPLDIICIKPTKKQSFSTLLFRQYLTKRVCCCTIMLVLTNSGGTMATWGRWGGTAVSSLPVRREVNANGQEKAAEDRDQRHRVDRGHRYSNYLRSNSVLTARRQPGG